MEYSIRSPSKMLTSIYYAHLYCVWERGNNENQNKLIRRFALKGTAIGRLTHKDVKRIEHWLNRYLYRQFDYQSLSQLSTLKIVWRDRVCQF